MPLLQLRRTWALLNTAMEKVFALRICPVLLKELLKEKAWVIVFFAILNATRFYYF